MKEISIVVPVFNEEDNIEQLHSEIKEICEKKEYVYEIIIIDDGSSDNSAVIIGKLSPVKLIKFRKNFGQTAAIDVGIKNARYEYIITMDGDGQNDPADIPLLIEYLEKNNLDVVSGWREDRKDKFFKRFTSRVANVLRKIIINDGIHDSGCSLKIYRKECFDQINLYGEIHRFIPAMLKIKGFRIGEITVNHRPRIKGKSKYNWRRSIKGFIDMISIWFWNRYAVKPLHLLGGIGLFLIFLGMISSAYTIYIYVIGISLSDTAAPILSAFLLLMGIQLFVLGLIADVISKQYFQTTKDKSYDIQKIVENN